MEDVAVLGEVVLAFGAHFAGGLGALSDRFAVIVPAATGIPD